MPTTPLGRMHNRTQRLIRTVGKLPDAVRRTMALFTYSGGSRVFEKGILVPHYGFNWRTKYQRLESIQPTLSHLLPQAYCGRVRRWVQMFLGLRFSTIVPSEGTGLALIRYRLDLTKRARPLSPEHSVPKAIEDLVIPDRSQKAIPIKSIVKIDSFAARSSGSNILFSSSVPNPLRQMRLCSQPERLLAMIRILIPH